MLNNKNNQNPQLKHYLRDYKIFIDTCSIMHDSADAFFYRSAQQCKQFNQMLYVPKAVILELEKFAGDHSDYWRQKKAHNGIRVLANMQEAGCLGIREEEDDGIFADHAFEKIFTHFRLQYNLILITQDKDLALEIYNLNKSKAVVGKKIIVMRLDRYGNLSNWIFDDRQNFKSGIPATNRDNHRSGIPLMDREDRRSGIPTTDTRGKSWQPRQGYQSNYHHTQYKVNDRREDQQVIMREVVYVYDRYNNKGYPSNIHSNMRRGR